MALPSKLKASLENVQARERTGFRPWQGPEEDGLTQSMINLFLICRERFRVQVMEGLAPVDQFNHRIEYGQMWHTAEAGWAKDGTGIGSVAYSSRPIWSIGNIGIPP